MYLRKNFYKKTGRTYLQIVHGYRDQKGNSKTKVYLNAGYLDILEKKFDDPIAHFENLAKQMEAERQENEYIDLKIKKGEMIDRNTKNRKNYGHIIFSRIYHELQLNRFFNNKQRHMKFKFDSNSIMKVLLFSRLLYPCSNKHAVEMKDRFFDKADFSLDDAYDCLTHFNKHAKEVQQFIHERITEQYARDTSLLYYDVTNYYFETDMQGGLRMNGPSKEKKKKPIVQMGLAMDKMSIPLAYQLFKGNTHDSQTLMPVLANIKKEYNSDRIIVVADKGLNSGDNIAFNTALGDGYVYSKSVRGASDLFKSYVLDDKGYIEVGTDYKRKSRVVPDEEISISVSDGNKKKKKKIQVEQKQVIFYSKKYAERSKHKRDEVVAKALDLIKNPSQYRKATSYGAASYICNLEFDKKTGEVLETGKKRYLDMDKIREDEKYDGYYAIVTSELDESDDRIIEIYRGLWRIEESFKITKSLFHARPVNVRTDEHINAHFLICFISLVIARLIEIRLKNKYPIDNIISTLRSIECSHLNANHYLFDYIDEIADDLNAEFNVDFGKKIMTLGEIKKNFGMVKKI